MNGAHSHLLINHFPIIGLILGILVLLIGILAKSSVTRRVGLLLFLIAGITSFPSFKTGENAEHYLMENTIKGSCGSGTGTCTCAPGSAEKAKHELHEYIEEHEEAAETFMPFMWGIIALSALAMFLEWKKKSMALLASIVVLLLGVFAAYFAREVGNSGGEIMHTEIRKGKLSQSEDHD